MSSPVLSAVREDSAVNSSSSSGPRTGGPRSRWSFTPVQKLEFLAAYEKACENNEGGAFLRREGLYSSQMTEWRRFREPGVLAGKKAGESTGKLTAEQAENARLRRQCERPDPDARSSSIFGHSPARCLNADNGRSVMLGGGGAGEWPIRSSRLVVQGRSAPPWGRKMWRRHLTLQMSGAFHRLWNTLKVCVSVNPGRPMVPVSLQVSLVVEGTALLSAGPWTVAFEHECQICCLIRPPRNACTLIPTGMTGRAIRHGSDPPAVRGY